MSSVQVLITRLDPELPLPRYAKGGDAGAGEGKGLIFPNFSDRGGGVGHLYPAGGLLMFSRILGWF